uniref:Uncharacterized protein n=1 Tax=Solanum lycopersicum TaxID=4081 RepID=A0A3Q7IFV7_SOLLC
MALYSASAELPKTVTCFLDLHEIRDSPYLIKIPNQFIAITLKVNLMDTDTKDEEDRKKKVKLLSKEQGQISIEMDRTLQERIRLEVDKEIQSCGFYNVEIQQMKKKLISYHHQKETKSVSMTSSNLALHQGNKKRLQCKKVQNNNNNDSIDSLEIPKKNQFELNDKL